MLDFNMFDIYKEKPVKSGKEYISMSGNGAVG